MRESPPEWWMKQHRKREQFRPPPVKRTARNREILRLRQEEGLTLRAIGERYGISHQRVHQIVKGFSLPCARGRGG